MSKFITREEALLKAAQKLDISPSKYKQAMERFETMQSYLLGGDYEGSNAEPEIYLQGSFKLGTEIRPYKDCKDADYDIDIVCRLDHGKEKTTPEIIKHQVGDHLKTNGTYERMLDDEGKRCWTLNYAEQDNIGFHMDILPSVQESWKTFKETYWGANAIAVTNKNSDDSSYDWSPSNPKDFAKWFYEKNNTAFKDIKHTQKQVLFEHYRKDGLFETRDSIPDIHIKTPLQRAIQLLKRHRDIRFSGQNNEKCKPISMIITVLAAQSYNNESTIYETLNNLLDTFSSHADQLQSTFLFDESKTQSIYNLITRKADGEWHIPNPTNHEENFADKWHEDNHARAKAFFQWVAWAKDDFINIAEVLDEKHFNNASVIPDNKPMANSSKSKALIFNAPHREKPRWPISLKHTANITAKFKRYGKSHWEQFNPEEPLEKNYSLLFKAKTSVTAPFQVYWQIVNTGKQAEDSDQLRGSIQPSTTAGTGGLTQKESTSYHGDHWIECFIVKNDECVARSGEFIVRIVS